MLCVGGTKSFTDPDTFFWGGQPDFDFPIPSWIMFVSAFLLPLLNPPIEELHYRGYAQPRLIAKTGSVRFGILITAVGFGLQHMGFAGTVPSAICFAVAFFLWGLGAGMIVHRQQRLFPIIVAHFISNLSFGVAPLVFRFSG